jgi:metal-sulfur cluster biosynthetic enzyme
MRGESFFLLATVGARDACKAGPAPGYEAASSAKQYEAMNLTQMSERDAILALLDTIKDPKTGRGLRQAGLVQGLVVAEGRAGFMIEAPPEDVALYAPVRDAAERALAAMPGITKAQVVLTTAAKPAAPGERAFAAAPRWPWIRAPTRPRCRRPTSWRMFAASLRSPAARAAWASRPSR